jgi:serine/threonine-protein kinase RsbW
VIPPSEQDERAGGAFGQLSGGAAGPPLAADLRFELVAELVSPSIARDRLDRWLRDLHWPAGQREDIVIALSEAVTNSVEHGYQIHDGAASQNLAAGTVEVRARVLHGSGRRRIALTVRDEGQWREPETPAQFRGHGLTIIRACADEFRIEGTVHGTTLTLITRAAPLPYRTP